MTQRIQANRFTDTTHRPPGTRPPGEFFVNYADLAMGVSRAGASIDLLPIRFHSPNAQYLAGDLVVTSGNIWQAKTPLAPHAFVDTEWNRYYTANQAVSDFDGRYLKLAGGTLTGPLLLSRDPLATNEAATKSYTDAGLATKLNLSGGTMTGPLTVAWPGISTTAGGAWGHATAIGWDGAHVHIAIDGTNVGMFLPVGENDGRYLSLSGGAVNGHVDVNAYGDFASSGSAAVTIAHPSEAVLAFLRPGQFGIKIGLDAANRFNIGGWSAGYGRMTLDSSGNLIVPGNYTGNFITTNGGQINGNLNVTAALDVSGGGFVHGQLQAGDFTSYGNCNTPNGWVAAGQDLKTNWGVSFQGTTPVGIWWDGARFMTEIDRGNRSYSMVASFSSAADNRVERFTINNSGYAAVFLNGGATLVGWPVSVSDRRLKSNIAPTTIDALDLVRRTQIYQADLTLPWSEDPQPRHLDFTFLADEVIETIPQAVAAMDDETALQMINPLHLVATLWRAVQQLEARLNVRS